MEAGEITFGLNTLMSILFGAVGAVGVWFTLKGQVSLLKQRCQTLEANQKIFNKRLGSLKDEVKENREKSDTAILEIGKNIQKMEIAIIKEIHNLRTGG